MSDHDSSNWNRLHWLMTIAILMLIQFVVQTTTLKYCNSVNALNYWSLVGTSVSIILALVAIIYSFIQTLSQQSSKDSIATQIVNLESLVASANKSEGRFSDELAKLRDAVDKSATSSDRFSEDLHRLDTVREHLETTLSIARGSQEQLTSLRQTTEQIRTSLQATAQSPQPPSSVPAHHGDTPNFDQLRSRTPVMAFMVIYACHQSQTKQRPFDLIQMSKCIDFHDNYQNYLYGFLMAMSAVGAIDCDVTNTSTERKITVRSVDKSLTKDIRKEVETKIKKLWPSDIDTQDRWITKLNTIDVHIS